VNHQKIKEGISRYASEKFGASIQEKDTSPFMKILSWILFFNRQFMTDFITVIFGVVYIPSRFQTKPHVVWKVLVHELIHVYDSKSWKSLWFIPLYLFPQSLVLFVGLAFVHSWWWLLTLLFLAPLPAYFRFRYEIRGYTGSMAAEHWIGNPVDHLPKAYSQYFINSSYYWMMPFKGVVENTLQSQLDKIKDGSIYQEIPMLSEMKEIVESNKG